MVWAVILNGGHSRSASEQPVPPPSLLGRSTPVLRLGSGHHCVSHAAQLQFGGAFLTWYTVSTSLGVWMRQPMMWRLGSERPSVVHTAGVEAAIAIMLGGGRHVEVSRQL